MKIQILLLLALGIAVSTTAQTNYTWNGSISNSWILPSNWTPAGIPGTNDNVKIVSAANNCQLVVGQTIGNLTLSSGTLDLGGATLTVGGAAALFNAGTIQNGAVNVSNATTTTFGSGAVTMNCGVTVSSATLTVRNTTFQAITSLTKTGASNDQSQGGNIFNGTTTITNAGGGFLALANANPDRFNAAVVFNNTGTASLYMAYNSTGNVFSGPVTFNNSPSTANNIYVSWLSAGTIFADNITFSQTSGQGIYFCGGNPTANASLAAGKTLNIGSGGFTTGLLSLRQFTQSGTTAQNLTLTGSATTYLGPSSTFNGALTVSSPGLFLNGAIYNGASNLTKTGATGDFSTGGNIFNGVSSITNSGSSYLVLGNSNPDTWNNDVIFTDNGSERLLPCWATAGNQFNGNIYVNTAGSAQGIQFCGGNTTATATLAATKTILPGSTGLTNGYLYLKQITQNGTAPINITATGNSVVYLGPSSTFGGAVSVTAPDIWAQGATYNAPAVFTKTGGNNNHNNQQQNIFNAACSINQQSSGGYFMLGFNSNDQFNDDIIVSSTGTGGIYLGWTSGTGTPVQAAGKTINVGSAGFSAGSLYLNTFTQNGNAAINLNFTGAGTALVFARGSLIGGPVTSSTPELYLNGCTFSSAVNLSKTGTNNNFCSGGNVFASTATLNNSGSGLIALGTSNPDRWNADATFNNSGSGYIAVAQNSAGNLFNGNVIVSSTGSSAGIYFCQNTGAGAQLAAGGTLSIGSAGFSSGTLSLRQFTQLGNVPIGLSLTGATTLFQAGPASAFGGNLTVNSPRILVNSSQYAGAVVLTKTGATGEWSPGGNTFNGTLTVNQQGGGFFGFANGSPDIYNGDVYLNNNSTDRIIIGAGVPGNQFNGNIILTQNGSSQGIALGWTGNTNETQAAGKSILIGAAGFSTGYLQLAQFTQDGTTAINLPLTGNSSLTYGPASSFGGNVVSASGSLYFNGAVFNGTVNAVKNGGSNDASSGSNFFNASSVFTNAGAGYLLFGNGNADHFNADASFINSGSANLYVAYNSANNVFAGVTSFTNNPTSASAIYVSSYSAGTLFSDNIKVSSAGGQGIHFCTGNTTAGVMLAAGKTISVSAGGFSAGILLLRQFTQNGATAQNLALTGTSTLIFGPSSQFDGDVTTVSPGMFYNGAVFNGLVTGTKNGSSNDGSQGGNIFNGTSSFINNGSGFLQMTVSAGDNYNGNTNFTQAGTGVVFPNYNNNSNYAGNVTIASPAAAAITFGSGTGSASFTGSGAQSISVFSGSVMPVFTRLTVANNGSGVTLSNTGINISKTLTLTTGLLNTSTSNILTMLNNSTTAAGTALSTSYVNGPMRYQKAASGSTILNFPIGNGSDCRPVSLTVNHTNGTSYYYQAQLYNASAQALNYTLPPTVDVVSGVHYYTIARTNNAGVNQPTLDLSGNQTIQVFYGSNDLVTNGGTLTLVKNTSLNPTKWIDIGGTGSIVFAGSGSVTSTSSPSAFNSFSTFALADVYGGGNVLPVQLAGFTAIPDNNRVNLAWAMSSKTNSDYFTLEKSSNGTDFVFLAKVKIKAADAIGVTPVSYNESDGSPYNGIGFYRLSLISIDGTKTVFPVQSVRFDKAGIITVYPNPTAGIIHISGLPLPMNSVTVKWYDLGGKMLMTQTVANEGGTASFTPVNRNGIYFLEFQVAPGVFRTQKIIIRK